jgi:hypothetical protein
MNERSVCSYFRISAFSGSSARLKLLRRLLVEMRTMLARSGTPLRRMVGFKRERHKPSFRSHQPFRCSMFTSVQLSR